MARATWGNTMKSKATLSRKAATLVLLGAMIFGATFATANATDVDDAIIGLWTEDEHVLVVDGGLGANTAFNFKRTLNENPQVRTILLNSGGGLVSAGLEIAQLIANRRLDTWVPESAMCASACSVVYFSGANRLADGQLGVHQIAMNIENNLEVQYTASDMIEAFNRYGTHPNVFAAMFRTPPDKMYFFTNNEKVLFEIQRGILSAPVRNNTQPLPELIPPEELFGNSTSILEGLKLQDHN